MGFQKTAAVLIDIDDTLARVKKGVVSRDPDYTPGNLFGVLQSAGVKLGGLSPGETARRIAEIQETIRWWHWSDFIVALELQPREFWEYAYEVESRHWEPPSPEIGPALRRMKAAGLLLYITSNNPSEGILHKLRMAGLGGSVHGNNLFDQILGVSQLQSMKWEVRYWKKALAHIGLNAEEAAVVGDSFRDDYAVPRLADIPYSFIINTRQDPRPPASPHLFVVENFNEIADRLLSGRPATGRRAAKAKPTA